MWISKKEWKRLQDRIEVLEDTENCIYIYDYKSINKEDSKDLISAKRYQIWAKNRYRVSVKSLLQGIVKFLDAEIEHKPAGEESIEFKKRKK